MRDMNVKKEDVKLLYIGAVEGYSYMHKKSLEETMDIFDKYRVLDIINDNYETLHIQGMDDTIEYIDSVVGRLSQNGE